jgi:hypothetical protein
MVGLRGRAYCGARALNGADGVNYGARVLDWSYWLSAQMGWGAYLVVLPARAR